MEWSLDSVLIQATLVITMVVGLLYSYITRFYKYWDKTNVPYLEPSFPFGNIQDLIFAKIDVGRFYGSFYNQFKSKNHQYGGIFELRKPTLILTDLDLVKQVLTKDFVYFMDRSLPPKMSHDFLANHLFAMEGKEWKDMRTKLTPTFTSGKMKMMYTLIEKCSQQLKIYLDPCAKKNEEIDIKEVMSRFTIDIIATCAFGLEVNTLADSDVEFYKISQKIFTPSSSFAIKRFFMSTFPRIASFFKMTLIHQEVGAFLLKIVENTVKYREENHIERNDFLDLLIKIKNNQPLDENSRNINGYINKQEILFGEVKGLTLKQMAAQAFVFFAAGFETAASTTTFILYELARNPEIQQKLRQEIDDVVEVHKGQITYHSLQEMTYMEQVVNETLRMHGSAPALVRKCTEPYRIPNTNTTLHKDVKIVIPSYAIHHDPEIYPEPEVFDPDRFSKDNIRSRHNYSFLPFGEGPRMCLGMRFGKMQVKAGLAVIISQYNISLAPETPVPVEINPKIIVTTPKYPIKLRISHRKPEDSI